MNVKDIIKEYCNVGVLHYNTVKKHIDSTVTTLLEQAVSIKPEQPSDDYHRQYVFEYLLNVADRLLEARIYGFDYRDEQGCTFEEHVKAGIRDTALDTWEEYKADKFLNETLYMIALREENKALVQERDSRKWGIIDDEMGR